MVWLKLKFGSEIDGSVCSQVFNRQIDLGVNWIKISVTCFESEDDIRKYEKKVTFAKDVDLDEMRSKEEGDGLLEL
jgi:hypothetical protein